MKKIVLILTLFTNMVFGQDTLAPMDLHYYQAKMNGNDAVISWITNNEKNTDYFMITKSYNGVDFYELGVVMGSGSTKIPKPYTYVDKDFIDYELFRNVIYYMLIHVDRKGSQTLFEPRYITFRKNVDKKVTKVINYLGQEVTEKYMGLKTYIYEDNTIERTF